MSLRTPCLRATAWFAGALLLSSAVSRAQSSPKVAIRPLPKAGEEIHVVATQSVEMRFGEKAAEPGPPQISMKGMVEFTQSNGAADAQGKTEARITITRFGFEQVMGANPQRQPDMSAAIGRVLVVTLDRTGKLLSIKVPPDMSALSARLTQVLAGAYSALNFLPSVDLAVGESTTSVTELPLRLPGQGARAPLQARTTIRLRAIEGEGKTRTARVLQDMDVATETATLKVSGGGSIDINLERGFIAANTTEWNIAGEVPAPPGSAASTMPVFASMKIVVSAH